MDAQTLFRNYYLKKQPIGIRAWKTNPDDKSGYGLNVRIENEDDISMFVEIGKKGAVGAPIYVNSNMDYIEHEYNTELLKNPVHPEDLADVKEFLKKNKTELKKLYGTTKKQYDLVNNL